MKIKRLKLKNQSPNSLSIRQSKYVLEKLSAIDKIVKVEKSSAKVFKAGKEFLAYIKNSI